MKARTWKFLSASQVIELHSRQIKKYGGLDGLGEPALLESAVSMPQARYDGRLLHKTAAQMAAAYLFHLCQAHAFVDGNKRVAASAAIVFLAINGFELTADVDAIEAIVMGVAGGQMRKAQVAAFFAGHIRRTPG